MILMTQYKKTALLFLSLVFTISLWGQSKPAHKKKHAKKASHSAADYMNMGTEKAKDGKYAEAVVDYDKSIALNNQNYEPWYNRGYCKVHLHDYEAAIPDFTEAIKLHRPVTFPDGLYYRGYCYNQTGRFILAISDFNKALEVTSNSDIWAARGFANLQTNNFQEAVADYTKAIATDRNNIEYFGLRALCRYNLHQLKETVSDAETFLAKKPASPDIIEIELKAKYEMADYEGALALAQNLVNLKKTPLTYYYKGSTEFYLQQYNEAVVDFTSAIAIDSNYRDAYYSRGLSYLGLNDDKHACPDLHKAQKLGFPGIKAKIDTYCKDIKE
jgi:tetratricopeptide (TPR) repeat protein